MKKVLSYMTVLLAAFLFAGCGSVGKNFDSSNVKNVRNNDTTQAQVVTWFGEPYKKGQENGKTMWTYQYDTYSGGDSKSKDLVLLFDDAGKVIAFRYTSNMDD